MPRFDAVRSQHEWSVFKITGRVVSLSGTCVVDQRCKEIWIDQEKKSTFTFVCPLMRYNGAETVKTVVEAGGPGVLECVVHRQKEVLYA